MKHKEIIKKYLGINTPDWIVKNVQNAIDEVLQDYIDNRYICGIDPISSEKGSQASPHYYATGVDFAEGDSTSIMFKIEKVCRDLKKQQDSKEVLVMNPITILLVKDKITRYHDIYNTREAFLFDGRVTVYVSLRAKFGEVFKMTQSEFDEWNKN